MKLIIHLKTGSKKHYHIQFYYLEKLFVAEHCIDLCHVIQLSDTSVLAKKSRHMGRKIMEVIETELHSKNMNKVNGFSVSRSWNPLMHTLK